MDNLSFIEGKPHHVEDGIPLFSPDSYWGKASASLLKEGIDVIDKEGWTAFEERFAARFDVTTDESRADWRFPIPITKESAILDIGAGLGRITIPLARIAGKVVSFDPSVLRMRYLKRRLLKEGLSNVELFVGDIYTAPLKKKTFDVVVMNGILEWVGLTDLYKNPREAQIACLKICKELLKDGGYLYVGIENRIALSYLRTADHGGLRYTSFMPRWLANIYVRLRQKHDYRTYTYTKRGYEKLFREAGFASPQFYLPYPGYNLPRITWPYENLEIMKYVLSVLTPETTFARKMVRKLAHVKAVVWLYRNFLYSFNIIARK